MQRYEKKLTILIFFEKIFIFAETLVYLQCKIIIYNIFIFENNNIYNINNMTKIITIGLSNQHFTSKPQGKQVGSLAFTVTTLTTNELLSQLTQGYCIAHVFGHNDTFTMKEKNNANFTSASFISVDVDDSNIDMYTYIQGLIHKPSIAYTTFSNQVED